MAPADQEQVKQIIKEAMTESLVAFFGPNKYFGGVGGKAADAVGKTYLPQGPNGQKNKPIKLEPMEE